MNAVIYARYSSDKQRETSIDDQIRLSRQRATLENIAVGQVFRDEGISGMTSITERPGAAAMMEAAKARQFDVLIIEGLDRLARDRVDQEVAVRLLEYWGVNIIGVADGYNSDSSGRKLHRGMRGIINEMYIDDLRHKTHRGLTGQVHRGFVAGAAPYGYRLVKEEAGSRFEIAEDQAKVVREIFERFAAGCSFKTIIYDLNKRGIPSPRGGQWKLSSIAGTKKTSSGLLHNEIYRGRFIWNRSQWITSPETGKRTRLPRPESEWVIQERPELIIISDELWNAADQRKHLPPRDGWPGQSRKTHLYIVWWHAALRHLWRPDDRLQSLQLRLQCQTQQRPDRVQRDYHSTQ